MGPDWFHPEPFFRVDVKDFRPGTSRRVGDAADGFPERLSKLPPGTYRAQALLAHNLDRIEQGNAPGNFYGGVVSVTVAPGPVQTVSLALDQVVKTEDFPDTAWLKEVAVPSKLLSQFHHRRVIDYASVLLPAGYDEHPDRHYPVLYEITGFGGSHRDVLQRPGGPPLAAPGDVELIRVLLDGQCEWGHHEYADSATNGPRGQALVTELIPEIERRFRAVGQPGGRFLAGHSSGGWSSLWLQVTYPDFFGGVWSTSPDPVDFRDFQQVDLYANPPLNLYFDPQGKPRPIARLGGKPALWFPTFGRMDDVLGWGGQLRSFEAVFSPLDADGLPRKLWDRRTGQIDPATAKAWEAYDIRLKLERNWADLGPRLKGKLHIRTGSLDTFYLNGAVEKLAASLKRLGSDAEITIVPGADHGTVLAPDYFRQARRQMGEASRAAAAK